MGFVFSFEFHAKVTLKYEFILFGLELHSLVRFVTCIEVHIKMIDLNVI